MSATDIILHHYDASPFSEKVRLIFGRKGLAWRSVTIPNMMPKPDLMPLTGGYRKTPVMQIGADIYCDTAAMIREIERRYPTPTLFPEGHEGMSWAISRWTDGPVFQASVAIIFGNLAEHLPDSFIKDRQDFAGARFDVGAMAGAVPVMMDQWRAHAGWLEDQLNGGRAYLLGADPSLADVSAYMNVWFMRAAFPPGAALLEEFPAAMAWAGRVAAIGHGHPSPLSSGEALAIARDAQSTTQERLDPRDPSSRKPGDPVMVIPDDTGRVPVTGTLVAADAQTIAIRRTDDQVGEIVIHFPRVGFHVVPA